MMIARAKGDGSDDEILILGLAAGNVQKLIAGQPIRLSRETHGDGIPDGWKILIFFGQTHDQMAQLIKPYIDESTQVFKDPRL